MAMELEEQYDRIYRYCYYRIHNQQLAEDITQQVFLKYFERREKENDNRPLALQETCVLMSSAGKKPANCRKLCLHRTPGSL